MNMYLCCPPTEAIHIQKEMSAEFVWRTTVFTSGVVAIVSCFFNLQENCMVCLRGFEDNARPDTKTIENCVTDRRRMRINLRAATARSTHTHTRFWVARDHHKYMLPRVCGLGLHARTLRARSVEIITALYLQQTRRYMYQEMVQLIICNNMCLCIAVLGRITRESMEMALVTLSRRRNNIICGPATHTHKRHIRNTPRANNMKQMEYICALHPLGSRHG